VARYRAKRKDNNTYAFRNSANYPKADPYEKFVAPQKDSRRVEQLRQAVDGRMKGLYQDRYSYWVHWRECSEVSMPRRYRWFITPNLATRGSPINQRIVDTTIIKALRDAAAGMMAGITSPARPWFRYGVHDLEYDEFSPEGLWLSNAEKMAYKICAKSNFYTAAHTVYEDLLEFGTAPMIVDEDYEDVIRCYNPCAGEYFVANSDRLEIDTFYRQFTMTARTVVQWFGLDNCSESVRRLFEAPGAFNQDKEIIIAHGIEPYDPPRHGNWPIGKDKKFIEVFWEYGSGQGKLLRVRGYKEFPVMVPRWYLVSNDSYGRSPMMDALGDTKQLMVEQRRKAQGIDKMVNPPLRAHVSLKNQPSSTLPGALTYVASVDNSQGIAPIYTVNPQLGELVEDIHEVQDRIRKIFFADVFLMLSQYEPKSGVSATEMAGRQQEAMLMMGPMLERFQNEFLSPFLNRLFNIMIRNKLLPPAPKSLQGKEISIEYISILAQAQKSAVTTGIERLSATVGSWAAVKPEVLDNLDFDEMTDIYGDALVVDPRVVVPKKKVAQIRAARAKMQQAQMQMQQNMAMADGAKTLSQADVGGGKNALQMMLGTNNASQQG
jgi:hypothetical protein